MFKVRIIKVELYKTFYMDLLLNGQDVSMEGLDNMSNMLFIKMADIFTEIGILAL